MTFKRLVTLLSFANIVLFLLFATACSSPLNAGAQTTPTVIPTETRVVITATPRPDQITATPVKTVVPPIVPANPTAGTTPFRTYNNCPTTLYVRQNTMFQRGIGDLHAFSFANTSSGKPMCAWKADLSKVEPMNIDAQEDVWIVIARHEGDEDYYMYYSPFETPLNRVSTYYVIYKPANEDWVYDKIEALLRVTRYLRSYGFTGALYSGNISLKGIQCPEKLEVLKPIVFPNPPLDMTFEEPRDEANQPRDLTRYGYTFLSRQYTELVNPLGGWWEYATETSSGWTVKALPNGQTLKASNATLHCPLDYGGYTHHSAMK